MDVFSLVVPGLQPVEQWNGDPHGTLVLCGSGELLERRGRFGFDPHTVEECLTVDDYAKLENYDTYDFLNIDAFYLEGEELAFEEVDIYVGGDYLVVIMDDRDMRAQFLEFVRGRLVGRRINRHNYIYYLLFDFLIDRTFQLLERLEDILQDLEMDILTKATKEKFDLIIERKAQINLIKKYVRPLIYVGDAFAVNENGFIQKEAMKYFRDVGMRFRKLYDFVVSLGELISQIQNSYDSAVSMRESEMSERLTMVAGLVAPLTVITGIYGMNFAFMPELYWKYSYPVVLAVMVLVEAGMYYLLRRRRR